jgi:hypothetical protein
MKKSGAKSKSEKRVIRKKKASTKSVCGKKKAAPKRKKRVTRKAPGYKPSSLGILVPDKIAIPVAPSKIASGLSKAKQDITALLDEIVSTMTEEYSVSEIELSASFSADGKFLGIGVGGATSITIRIKPDN